MKRIIHALEQGKPCQAYLDWYALWGNLGLTLPNLSGIGLLGIYSSEV